MKKTKLFCCVIITIFNVIAFLDTGYGNDKTTFVNEQNESIFHIKKRERKAKVSNVLIKGFTPIVENAGNLELQKSINASIEKAVKTRIEEAVKEEVSIEFSYDEYGYEGGNSIVLNTITMNSDRITKSVVDTFVFDNEKIVTIEGCLGVNGINLLNKFISDEIKSQPNKYSPNFGKVSDQTKFYLSGSKVVVVFDDQTSGLGGIVEFKLDIRNLYSAAVLKGDYTKKGRYSLKMIPLRTVCEQLGYSVKWNSSDKIEIFWEKSSTYIQMGKNLYRRGKNTELELEASPEFINGVTYVPISFFEIILDATYTVDDKDNIFFNKYWK